MIVSIALLGFGASGTFLAIFTNFGKQNPRNTLACLSFAAGLSMIGSYLLTNWIPFDSFSIALDRRQIGILAAHFVALSAPFFFSGLAVGFFLNAYPMAAGQTYAINLLGSSLGCGIALLGPAYLSGEGTVVFSCSLACFAAFVSARSLKQPFVLLLSGGLLLFCLYDLGMRVSGLTPLSWLELRLSPYKSLSYALQYPGAKVISRRWNSFSRVDLVRSQGIRSLPGLSYRYLKPPPAEDGVLADGDELSPIILPGFDRELYQYLPTAIAFLMRPGANALILEPRGGLDVLTALNLGASSATVVEVNPLFIQAANHIYDDARLEVVVESDRSFTRRSKDEFEVVVLSLANSYHPVRSGAYSLAEDYRYTVESFQDAMSRLKPGGLLIVTRWLQTPPSECLRTFSLAITALERLGADPRRQIIAFRGYNIITFLIKNGSFTVGELNATREFTSARAFDLVYAPDIHPDETNLHNILPESIYYQTFMDLLNAPSRQDFYQAYPFEISPPTDDYPFFGHFFKWSQTKQIWAEFGKTWQPFGGAGYFVILALLILATILAFLLILLPVAISHWRSRKIKRNSFKLITRGQRYPVIYLAYFALIGFAYLLVEIPLIQRFILFLGNPAYAMATVLFTLLLFSGLGSLFSGRIRLLYAIGALILLLAVLPLLFPGLFNQSLGLSLPIRLGITILVLAPIGFLMGFPFPGGIQWVLSGQKESPLIPWVWAVNGAASVVSSILAALLALSSGFGWVFRVGALCYIGAWLAIMGSGRLARSQRPRLSGEQTKLPPD